MHSIARKQANNKQARKRAKDQPSRQQTKISWDKNCNRQSDPGIFKIKVFHWSKRYVLALKKCRAKMRYSCPE